MNLSSLLLLAAVTLVSAAPRKPVRNTIPHIAMVEFETGPGCSPRKVISDHLNAKGIAFDIRTEVNTDIFCGGSFSVDPTVDAQQAIGDIANVINVFPIFNRDPPQPVKLAGGDAPKNAESIHTITGVNDARNKLGLTGKGIKVAIIDSGVYYLHPALGGGFGPGYKVIGGYDLVGDAYTGSNTPIPDNDPIDNCSGESHGTHVAGIVAGDSRGITADGFVPAYPYTGAAPGASIIAIRVFGCEGSVSTDIVAAGIYKAVELGADVINLSLGGGPAYSDEVDAIAATRAGKKGHIVLSANGNDGDAGLFVNGDPGDAKGGFGVASFDNVEVVQFSMSVDGTDYPFSVGSNNASFVYPADFTGEIFVNDPTGTVEGDGCTSVSPDVKGKVALLHWGGPCGSNGRCTNAAKAGATHCLIYSNGESIINIAGTPLIPSASLTQEAGAAIVKAIAGGKSPKVVLTDTLKNFPLMTAGTVSDFSSGGFDMELNIKPDIGGIGGNVYSTISPHSRDANNLKNSYAVYSGTSMATPYTAGCVALLLQKRGKMEFDYAHALLQNTAIPRKIYKSDLIDSVARQGSGLVNIYNAATTRTFVFPSSLSLNDTVRTKDFYYIYVVNTYRQDVEYYFNHTAAATANPFIAGDDSVQVAATTAYTNDSATLYFGYTDQTCYSAKIRRGGFKVIPIAFQPPNLNPALFPIYSGYVTITNNVDDSVITVPYAGMIGDWSEAVIWSRNSTEFGQPAGIYQSDTATPLPEGFTVNMTADALFVYAPLSTTTRSAQVDISYVGKDKSVIATLKSLGLGNSTNAQYADGLVAFLPDPTKPDAAAVVAGIGQRNTIAKAQSLQAPLNGFFFGQVFANLNATESTSLPAGEYQIRFKALKHFRKFTKGKDAYDTILSPKFNIVY